MRKINLHILLVLFFCALLSHRATAQAGIGVYPFGSFENHSFDTVNTGNLNVHFALPVVSKAGRGGLSFSYNLGYDSMFWQPATIGGATVWNPNNYGWAESTAQSLSGELFFQHNLVFCQWDDGYTTYSDYEDEYSNFTYYDSNGVPHSPTGYLGGCAPETYMESGDPLSFSLDPLTDGSGITFQFSGFGVSGIVLRNGTTVTPPQNPTEDSGATVTDLNGNQLTYLDGVFTDTTGTSILQVTGDTTDTGGLYYTYPTYYHSGSGGTGTQAVVVTYHAYNVLTNFGCSGISEYSASDNLVDKITYPDGSFYSFTYEQTPSHSGYVTGRIDTLTLPTGGRVQYLYSGGNHGIDCSTAATATLTRKLLDDTSTPTRSYTTSAPNGSGTTHTVVTDGMSTANNTVYDFVIKSGVPYETLKKAYEGAATGTPVRQTTRCYNTSTAPCTTTAITAAISQIDTTEIRDGVSTKATTLKYDSAGMLTEEDNYDFGTSSPGALLQSIITAYDSGERPTSVETFDGSGNAIKYTTYAYDEYTPTSTSGLPQHVGRSGARENLTSINLIQLTSGGSSTVSAHSHYNDAGQKTSSTDFYHTATTTYAYDSMSGTFPVSVTYPTVGGVTLSTSTSYDVPSGQLKTSTDANSNTTTYKYDVASHFHEIDNPDSGVTTIAYTPYSSSGPTLATVAISVLQTIGGANITKTRTLDSYGRLLKLTQPDGSSTDVIDYTYNGNENIASISNPYQSTSDEIYGVTKYSYDVVGRLIEEDEQDSSSVFSAATQTPIGNKVTLKDEQSKQRSIYYDGLGRIASVHEDDGTGGANYETDYAYYANYGSSPQHTYQTTILQKGGSASSSDWRARSFIYDMYGRVVTENTPEAGTLTLAYTNSGQCSGIVTLPCTKTDANGSVVTYSYDGLNRLTQKSYSTSSPIASTPTIHYYYDQTSATDLSTIANGLGQQTSMSDGSGTTAWSYDVMGRYAATGKTINGISAQAAYTYNADGSIHTLQDFNSATLTYSYDGVGRQTVVSDGTNTYADSATYNAASQLTGMQNKLTSSSATYARSLHYNTRLWPASISATLNGSGLIQSLNYDYGNAGSRNGNVAKITNGTDAVSGTIDTSINERDQVFSYDSLNRLTQAQDGSNWGEQYTYDPWGNMLGRSRLTSYSGGYNWSPSITSSIQQNQMPNLLYDSAGQVTRDQYMTTYTYDAEGKIVGENGTTISYAYDGKGNRVEANQTGFARLFWPSEIAGIVNASIVAGGTTSWGKDVYLAGQHIWTDDAYGTTNFLFQDAINSSRVAGDQYGNMNDDIDYLPFGDVQYDYGSQSAVNYLFTGYGLDYYGSTDYAVFRNLSGSMARFTRPDPYDGSYDLTNPQTLNRYSYVYNRPLVLVDIFGLDANGNCGPGDICSDQNGNWWYVNPDGSLSELFQRDEVLGGNGGGGYMPDGLYTSGTSPDPRIIPQVPNHDGGLNPYARDVFTKVGNSFPAGLSDKYLPDSVCNAVKGIGTASLLLAVGAPVTEPITAPVGTITGLIALGGCQW